MSKCTQCICRTRYDIFNQDAKVCEHWLRSNCPVSEDGNPCKNCTPKESCEHFKQNTERIEPCLLANNQVYEDGYRFCPLVDPVGCEECMKEFEGRMEEE